jgi:cobaltochelatase CobS
LQTIKKAQYEKYFLLFSLFTLSIEQSRSVKLSCFIKPLLIFLTSKEYKMKNRKNIKNFPKSAHENAEMEVFKVKSPVSSAQARPERVERDIMPQQDMNWDDHPETTIAQTPTPEKSWRDVFSFNGIKKLLSPAIAFETIKLKDVFGIDAPDTVTIRRPVNKVDHVPKVSKHFFESFDIRRLLMWISVDTPIRNLSIIGGKGVGKSSLIMEFCARMHIPVYSISCSGKTRFQDLVGTLVIDTKGCTKFVYGPLAMAYIHGGVFLANEISRMDAGEQMRFVDCLDHNSRLTVTQTGEILNPHPDFRFACTGNSGGFGDESGAYAGEKTGSSAFQDRFLKIGAVGLPEHLEVELIASIIGINGVAKEMVTFSRAVRSINVEKNGGCRIDVSPRATILWAKTAMQYKTMKGVDSFFASFNDVVLEGAPYEDRKTVETMYKDLFAIAAK